MTAPQHPMKALLIDPSLFTAPYDSALTEGLISADVEPMWATRPTRRGDRQEIPIERTDPFFYRRVEGARWLPEKFRQVLKGASHLLGLVKLLRRIRSQPPDVVHFQWIVVPVLDVAAMALIRRWRPLVLTVHDTVPFNGQRMSWLQRAGHRWPIRLAHRVIVHTRGGRQALIDQGVAPDKVVVIPHGPLCLPADLPTVAPPPDARWTFLLFGEIKPYKGLDLLVDAMASLPEPTRRAAQVIVAGRPRMDIAPLVARIQGLGLDGHFDLRLWRQTEAEMATLFASADCFVFPYRQIDASGVYFLVKGFGRWLIASRVGIFAEDVVQGVNGALVPVGDVIALAGAMAAAISQRPCTPPLEPAEGWTGIGQSTRALYQAAILDFGKRSQSGRRATVPTTR